MEFINEQGTYDCEKLKNPELYTAFQGQFEEVVDVTLCKMMMEDTTIVPITVKEPKLDNDGSILRNADEEIIFETKPFIDDGVEQTVPLFSLESKREMKKIVDNISNGSINQVRYSAKRGGVGRRYCDYGEAHNQQPNPSLTTISRNMRNTLYHYQGWKDFDFTASHPTIMSILAKKLDILTPRIDEWIEDKEPIIKMLSEHHSVEGSPPLQKDHIKKMICMTLYGGGIKTWATDIRAGNPYKNESKMKVQKVADGLDSFKDWREIRANHTHPYFNELKQECKVINERLWKNNHDFRDLVCDKGKDESSQKNQFTSYYLGVIENHCLYHAYKYFVDSDIIESRKCSLAYDGFTVKCKHPYTDYDFHLRHCNKYILDKTGFAMKLIDKKFEESTIQLPIIQMRRDLPTAEIAPPVMEVQAEAMANEDVGGDATVEEQHDQQYLIWRDGFEKNHCKIIDSSLFLKSTYKEDDETGDIIFDMFVFMSRTNLLDSYGNLNYTKRSANGNVKKIFYIKKWLEDNNMRSYQKCDAIPPPLKCPDNVFNTWTQSPFYKQDITRESPLWKEDAIELFTSHIDILCDHNSEAAVYVLKWMAQFIQQPSVKTTHICITGEQGTGKSLAFGIYKKIIAGGAFETTSPEEHVWGKYNGQLLDKNLIIISETNKANSYGSDGKIKALITDSPVTIRQLYTKPIDVRSHHRFITLTNHPDPIKMEKTDRRNFVIRCSSEKIGDKEYFKNFANKFNERNYLLTLYSYLNALDIDGWDFRLDPKNPITEYQYELMNEHNRDPLDEFLEWWVGRQVRYNTAIEEGDLKGCVVAYGSGMLTDFKTYKETNGGKYEVSGAGDLVKKLKLNLNLPELAIENFKTTKNGKSKIYNIDILKKHYKISLVSSPTTAAAGGGSYANTFEDGNNQDSQDILVGDKDSDDEIAFAPRDGRRSSSLLSMRASTPSSPSAIDMGSLTNPLQEIEDELAVACLQEIENEMVTAEVVYQNPLQHLNEDEEKDDDFIKYKCRLEMPGDFKAIKKRFIQVGITLTDSKCMTDEDCLEGWEIYDKVWSFTSKSTLDELRAEIGKVTDVHVALGTLERIENYTGERSSEVEEAFYNKITFDYHSDSDEKDDDFIKYKCRLEAPGDWKAIKKRFIQVGILLMESKCMTDEDCPEGLEGLLKVWSFTSKSTLDELRAELGKVTDAHVALGTLERIENYTGERSSVVEEAFYNKITFDYHSYSDEEEDDAIDGRIYVNNEGGLSNHRTWDTDEDEEEVVVTENISLTHVRPTMPLDSYDHHAKNGDIEYDDEEEQGEKDSDYEQEGQPSDCDSDEEEDTREVVGTLKDSNGRSIILKKREKKY